MLPSRTWPTITLVMMGDIDTRRAGLRLVGALTWIGIALAAGPAVAQDANALVEEGLSLREQGDDAAALQRFEQAYEIDPSPRTLAQIALAEMALGRWLEAEAHLAVPLATQHEWVEANRLALNGAMAGIRAHIGRLMIESDPSGAELWVAGESAGTLPLATPLALSPGAVEIEVRLEGHVTETRTLQLVGGQITRELVRLHPEGGAPESAGSAPSDGGGGISIPGVVLVGVGAAALISGAVLTGLAFADEADLEDPEGMPRWSTDAQARADNVPVMAAVGEALLGIGVAAAVVGAILLVVDSGGGDASRARLRDGRLEWVF